MATLQTARRVAPRVSNVALRARRRDVVVALALCVGLAVLFAAGVWTHLGTRWLGDAGDPQQTTWFLRWTPYAITHGQDPLLTDRMVAPGGVNLMWNTPVMLLGVLLAPITLTLGAVVAYNVAVMLALAASGFAAYLALRRVVGPGAAALVGALFYEFSPYTTAHALGQLNLTVAVLPPLLVLLLHEVLVRRRWSARRAGPALGALAVLQAFVSQEMLASSGIAAVVFIAVLWWRGGRTRADVPRRAAAALGLALTVFVPLMAVPLAVQLLGPQALHGAVQTPGVFVGDLLGLVVPTQSQLLSTPDALAVSGHFSGNPVEWTGYLGVPLLVLWAAAAARWWRRDPRVRVASICGLVFLVLSLGPSLHVGGVDTRVPLPWAAVDHVPFLSDLLPARLSVYVDLCAAVVLAITVQNVLSMRVAAQRRHALLALAIVGVSILPAMPLPTDTVPVPSFFTSGAAAALPAEGSVLVAPFTTDFTAVAPMAWQAAADLAYRMPGGYAMVPDGSGAAHQGPLPTALSDALQSIAAGHGAPPITDGLRARMRDDLRHWDVRAALVGPMSHGDEATAFLTTLFGCTPQHVGGVDVWWHAGADGCG